MDFKKSFSARKIVFFFVLILVSLFLSAFAPLPQAPTDEPILDRILRIATGFGALAGVSALVGIVIGFLRAFNVVKTDDQAGRATATLNLISFVALVLFGVFRPDLSLDFLDATAATLASIGLYVLGLVLQMITPAPVLRLAYQARIPKLAEVGERTEARAHFIGAPREVRETVEGKNWTTETPDPTDRPSKKH